METPGDRALNTVARNAAMVWRPALLAAGLVAAALALREGWGHSVLDAPAKAGPAVFILAGAAACAIGIPRQAVAYAGGLGFGAPMGCLLALCAELLGCAADFLWARLIMRDWAARRIRGRAAQIDTRLARYPFTATLTLRLLPVGSNIVLNLLAGVSKVAALPFLAGSAIGFLPQTVVFALLGGGLRVNQTEQFILAAILFVIASALGFWLLRRMWSAELDRERV